MTCPSLYSPPILNRETVSAPVLCSSGGAETLRTAFRGAEVLSSVLLADSPWFCFRGGSWRALEHVPVWLGLEELSPGDTMDQRHKKYCPGHSQHIFLGLGKQLRLKVLECLGIIAALKYCSAGPDFCSVSSTQKVWVLGCQVSNDAVKHYGV